MDQASIETRLADLHLPAIRFYNTIDSTNDEAWRWTEMGAPHKAMVIADEQTAGRGRLSRRWVTMGGYGLAFSLVLRSPPLENGVLSHLTGLGALATCLALDRLYSLPAQVKWPNDILLEGCKTGGILVETRWRGEELTALVMGIGINIAPESLSPAILPVAGLRMPATCVEKVLGRPVDRLDLLHGILQELFGWLPRLSSPDFIHTWETRLAFREQWVELISPYADLAHPQEVVPPPILTGKLVGLSSDGSIQLLTKSGELVTAQVGEIHLRLVTSPPG